MTWCDECGTRITVIPEPGKVNLCEACWAHEEQYKRDCWFIVHYGCSETDLLQREARFARLLEAMRPEGWR